MRLSSPTTPSFPHAAVRSAGRFFRIPLAACLALGLSGLSDASAETGKLWIDAGTYVQFQNVDLSQPAERARLIAMVEGAAADHCKPKMIRKQGCIRRAVERSLQSAAEPIRQAMILAQAERTPVAQAQLAEAMR